MARKPRIEYPGAFLHIIARGNNRQDIFIEDEDRQNYLNRVAAYFAEGKITLYCFCLMTNHVHLLLEMAEISLSFVLQRLHTWYARHHNHKYNRVGHLFQGRYKAVLCDKDAYLLELVRYIHLNPVRAGMATNPAEYPWSSHLAYLGREKYDWLATDLVLSQFAGNLPHARKLYEEFVMSKLGVGSRQDLYSLADQRILGKDDFVSAALDKAEKNRPAPRRLFFDLPLLEALIERELNMDPNSMRRQKRSSVPARRVFCYVARKFGGFRSKTVAAYLGKDPASVTQGVRYITEALKKDSYIQRKVTSILSSLEKNQTTYQERISMLRNFFSTQKRKILLAYLFGSAARDRLGPISDVDIAILYAGEFDWKAHFELAHQLQALLRVDRVDLVALNKAPVELARACIVDGVLLHAESRAARVDFEARVLALYGDFLPVLQRQTLEILEPSNEKRVRRCYEALGETERMLGEIGTLAPEG